MYDTGPYAKFRVKPGPHRLSEARVDSGVECAAFIGHAQRGAVDLVVQDAGVDPMRRGRDLRSEHVACRLGRNIDQNSDELTK